MPLVFRLFFYTENPILQKYFPKNGGRPCEDKKAFTKVLVCPFSIRSPCYSPLFVVWSAFCLSSINEIL